MMTDFVTFIAHGSSVPESNQFLKKLIEDAFPLPNVNIGFMEFASPTVTDAMETHFRNQAKAIRVIPLFLAPGKHIREDIPEEVQRFKQAHPEVKIQLEDFVGNHEQFKKVLKILVR